LSISSTPTSARATAAQQKQRGCSMSSTNGSRAANQDLKGWFLERAALDNPICREFHLFALLSGCRPTALQEINPGHVDFRRRIVHIPKPKGGAKRAFDIPLSREMILCIVRAIRFGRQTYPS
jgi:integrase